VSARRYITILKGKQGELNALGQAGPDVLDGCTPLLEVIGQNETDDRAQLVSKTTDKIAKVWSPGRPPLIVDAADLDTSASDPDDGDATDEVPVVRALVDSLRTRGIGTVPVVRLTDPEDVFEALRESCARDGLGAAVRLTPSDLDDSVLPLEQLLETRAQSLGLDSPALVDVVLDFGSITDENALALAARLGRFLVNDLTRQPWRTAAVGAGAFPPDLSKVAPNTIGSVPRLDKQLWQRLSGVQTRRPLDFADYAVTNPFLPVGGAFAAPPQLRYTTDDAWLVMKGRRQDRLGHKQFFGICLAIAQHEGPAFDASLSWGDSRIHEAALSVASEVARPGNAATWRSIATSHHLAWVVRSLRERDEP
jgi:hypothetical protein